MTSLNQILIKFGPLTLADASKSTRLLSLSPRQHGHASNSWLAQVRSLLRQFLINRFPFKLHYRGVSRVFVPTARGLIFRTSYGRIGSLAQAWKTVQKITHIRFSFIIFCEMMSHDVTEWETVKKLQQTPWNRDAMAVVDCGTWNPTVRGQVTTGDLFACQILCAEWRM